MVGKDSPTTSINEFKTSTTLKIGTQKGTTNYDEAVKLVGEARVTGFDTFGDAVQALIAKDVDGLMMAGRCISGDFISHSSCRVTGNAVAMGEAAGKTAAVAAKSNRLPQEIKREEIAG